MGKGKCAKIPINVYYYYKKGQIQCEHFGYQLSKEGFSVGLFAVSDP